MQIKEAQNIRLKKNFFNKNCLRFKGGAVNN